MDDRDEALKQRVLRCRCTGEGREELVAELAVRAYRFAGHRRGASEDEPGEFLLYMYPRLHGLILRYQDVGVPFEHYFNSVLAWNLRSYRRRARGLELDWQAGRVPVLWPGEGLAGGEACGDLDAPGQDHEEAPCPGPRESPLPDPAARKRFLLLVLRNCWRLGPGQLARAARIACVPADWLAATADTLRGGLVRRAARLDRLRGRRNAAYARMRLLQERRRRALDPEATRRLDGDIAREAAVWRRSCDLIRRVPLEPTQRRIASELGLPRGTVDTCLRVALLRAEGLLQSDAIRYA